MAENTKKKTPIEEKRLKQAKKRNKINNAAKSAIKTAVKKAVAAIETSNEQAKDLISKAYKVIDTAKAKGIIKKNTASRKKSRLMRKLNKATVTEEVKA